MRCVIQMASYLCIFLSKIKIIIYYSNVDGHANSENGHTKTMIVAVMRRPNYSLIFYNVDNEIVSPQHCWLVSRYFYYLIYQSRISYL